MPELWPSRTSYLKVITVIGHLSNNSVCNNHQNEAGREIFGDITNVVAIGTSVFLRANFFCYIGLLMCE